MLLFTLTLVIADCLALVSVAQQLCEQKTLVIANHEMCIAQASCSVTKKESSSDSRDVGLTVADTGSSAYCRTIFIEDVPLDLVEFLELHLESEKKGGGAIEELRHKNDGILVTFEQLQGLLSRHVTNEMQILGNFV